MQCRLFPNLCLWRSLYTLSIVFPRGPVFAQDSDSAFCRFCLPTRGTGWQRATCRLQAHARFSSSLPWTQACVDPSTFRSLMVPSDRPDDEQADTEKPRLKPCWKMCKCEFELEAMTASSQERCAEKFAVSADTTIMKELKENSGDVYPTACAQAFSLRPLLLQIFADFFDKHKEQMPHCIVELVDHISRCLCWISLCNTNEQ